MAFKITVHSEKLIQQFGAAVERVENLDQQLPDVFLDWQREDMKRKYPHIDEKKELSVTTLVYPRSRKPRTKKRGSSGKSTTRKRARRKAGDRPILRPELVAQLFARMSKMCREAIEWR